ncbi:hypothetical protein ACI2KR_30415 [Pseudomonas luteola]
MKAKSSHVAVLSGALLDCMVDCILSKEKKEKLFLNSDGFTLRWHKLPPPYSTDWAHSGPAVEANWGPISQWLLKEHGATWAETIKDQPLIWFCRAIVASECGDVVYWPIDSSTGFTLDMIKGIPNEA